MGKTYLEEIGPKTFVARKKAQDRLCVPSHFVKNVDFFSTPHVAISLAFRVVGAGERDSGESVALIGHYFSCNLLAPAGVVRCTP